MRVLHWGTALILGIEFLVVFGLQGPASAMMIWMPWHISLGMSLLGLTLVRLAVRLSTALRAGDPNWLARISHVGLYILLLAVSLTGWLAYRPNPLLRRGELFGVFPLPALKLQLALPWTSVHTTLVWSLVALLGLHVLATIYHYAFLRDRVLQRMVVGR